MTVYVILFPSTKRENEQIAKYSETLALLKKLKDPSKELGADVGYAEKSLDKLIRDLQGKLDTKTHQVYVFKLEKIGEASNEGECGLYVRHASDGVSVFTPSQETINEDTTVISFSKALSQNDNGNTYIMFVYKGKVYSTNGGEFRIYSLVTEVRKDGNKIKYSSRLSFTPAKRNRYHCFEISDKAVVVIVNGNEEDKIEEAIQKLFQYTYENC